MAGEGGVTTLEAAMNATARAVERVLNALIPEVDGPEKRLFSAMRYAALAGGKRLRPFIVLSSADLFGVSKERAMRVAAALECIHTYSLIHDDLPCMDNADLRRGQPTVHLAYDEATAVLAGDALLTLAFEIVSDEKTHSDPRVRCDLVRALASAAGPQGMVGGQMIDLESEHKTLDIGGVTRLQQMKTGALISFAAEAGAIMGRVSADKRQSLRAYAHDLGLAFQIVDDLLDASGDAAEVGKDVGKDAESGKATFVTILGLDRARQQAELLTDQAIQHLDIFGESADLLRSAARFVIHRRL